MREERGSVGVGKALLERKEGDMRYHWLGQFVWHFAFGFTSRRDELTAQNRSKA